MSAAILGGFAAISTTLLLTTHIFTKDAISESERLTLLKNLQEILPEERFDNDLLNDRIEVLHPLLGSNAPVNVYRARLKGKNSAVIINTQANNGYNGRIKMLVGINIDGTLAGVRVISHKETPGLGDDIELSRSNWVLSFSGKSIINPGKKGWQVKKDGGYFDQFTGATITPRAVVQSVHKTLKYYNENTNLLLEKNALR